MLTSASGIRARSLLRRYWVATVALGVFAGVAGGAALGLWGVARRTSTAYDRFVAYENSATFSLFACAEGVTEEEIYQDFQNACGDYDYADLLDFLATVDGVVSAGRWTQAIGNVASADDPGEGWRQLIPVAVDPETNGLLGRPLVVDGRLADPEVASEVTVNEDMTDRLGVGVGDELVITPYRRDQFDDAGEGVRPAGGQETTVNIVGVTRRPSDLIGRLGGTSIYEDTSSVMVGPAWWEQIGGDAASYAVALGVRTDTGTTNEDVMAAVHSHWPGRPFFAEVGPLTGGSGQETVVDAIRLQTLGLYLIAGVVAVAALAFAGQTLARQVRREWGDAAVLEAIGMTRSGMTASAALRAVGFAIIAMATALAVAILMSPLGPLGIGRAAEPDPGVAVDLVVLAIGLPLTAVCVLLFAVAPVATISRRSTSDGGLSKRSGWFVALPPTGVAGWAMTRSRRAGGMALGSAVIGVALASGAGIAAWSLLSSYDDLVANPARFGSSWDAQVGNVGSLEQQADTRARLESIQGIRAVGVKSGSGIGSDPTATIFAAEPFLGDVTFGTFNEGRAPVTMNEVAVGRRMLDSYGVEIGETIEFANPDDPSELFRFDVVGEVVVNDTLTAHIDNGALLTDDAFTGLADALSQNYVIWIDSDVDRDATLDALREEFPTTFMETNIPRPVQNLGLVSGQPGILALVVGLLAGAAMIHALVSSVRQGRRQLGVLKTIGFTRRQVAAAVAWHASALAFVALMMGVPLGVIVSRLVWTQIVSNIGLVSAPVISVPAVAVVILLVFAATNLAALGPAIVAARTRPAQALRTE